MAFRPLGSFSDEMDAGENTPVGNVVQKVGQATKSAVSTTAQSVKQQVGVADAANAAGAGFLDALYGSSTGDGEEPSPDNSTGVISHQQQKPQHGTAAPQHPGQMQGSMDPKNQEVKKRIEEIEAEIKKYADQREQRDMEREQEEEQEKQQMEQLEEQKKQETPLAVQMATQKAEKFRGAGG